LRQVRFDGVNQQDIVELQYRYDALKRPVYEIDAEQNTITADYDPWGTCIATNTIGQIRSFTSYLVGQSDIAYSVRDSGRQPTPAYYA